MKLNTTICPVLAMLALYLGAFTGTAQQPAGNLQVQLATGPADSLPPPLVALTFDDAEIGHYAVAAYLLKQYGFGATFFVCEFPLRSPHQKTQYMDWPQIKELNDMGFEIGNHTGHHRNMTKLTEAEKRDEVSFIETKCREWNIPKPVSFAYPGNRADSASVALLAGMGYRFARVGGSRLYEPDKDNLLLIPSYTVASTDKLKERIVLAIGELEPGQRMVLLFHGIPDLIHPDYSTSVEFFQQVLDLLNQKGCSVVALRDINRNRTEPGTGNHLIKSNSLQK